MCSEPLPKEFEKTTEVLPITKYGISTYEDFKNIEKDVEHQEWLKKVGLSNEEIKLYQENEAGLLHQRNKIELNVLKEKLDAIYNKINRFQNEAGSSKYSEEQPSTSKPSDNIFERLQKKPVKFYPDGHPMNELKEIEESLFGHLRNDDIIPITKRRKILRRLERKKQRILSQTHPLLKTVDNTIKNNRPGTLWDMKEAPVRVQKANSEQKCIIGPKKQTMYTIKDNKIVRLEPVNQDGPIKIQEVQNDAGQSKNSDQECERSNWSHGEQNELNKRLNENLERPNEDHDRSNEEHDRANEYHERQDEYRAVDIVIPINAAEEQLLEGTKMSVDDIRKIDRFKDYEPGIPSKVLYLKNIAPSVEQEQLSLLFNQFVLDNGGPVDVRLMTGRMRGQAFVSFNDEDLAIRALEEVNGTILSGRPVIATFGRNSNRVQDNDR